MWLHVCIMVFVKSMTRKASNNSRPVSVTQLRMSQVYISYHSSQQHNGTPENHAHHHPNASKRTEISPST